MEEVWKPVVGFEGLYEVSDLGKVKSILCRMGGASIPREMIMKQHIQKNRHSKRACIFLVDRDGVGRHMKVHQMVAQAFIPNPNDYTSVIHLDGNGLNNSVDNLEWRSDVYINSNIKNEKIREEICKKYQEGIGDRTRKRVTMRQLADEYGVSYPTINRILKRNGISRSRVLKEREANA